MRVFVRGTKLGYVNYQEIPWRNGKFDPKALDNAFATVKRAKHIFHYWQQHRQSRTLAFCVSRRHADYMADYFNKQNIKAAAVFQGSVLRRNEALSKLANRELEALFSVDLFNEGIDLPAIDTVLMLRPTESKILFLQQLGRGLRRSDVTDKSHLVVLDFIGNHQSFLLKPATLFNQTGLKQLATFSATPPLLADGCYVNFAPELVAFWQHLAHKVKGTAAEDYQELATELGHRPTATEFFLAGYDFTKVRMQHGSWFQLVAEQEQDAALQALVEIHKTFLSYGVETTALTRSFKMILLRAFLELDGFRNALSTVQLAENSWHILWRRPDWARRDIKDNLLETGADSEKWHQYWLKNPLNFYTKPDQKSPQAWFRLQNNYFSANFTVAESDIMPLTELLP